MLTVNGCNCGTVATVKTVPTIHAGNVRPDSARAARGSVRRIVGFLFLALGQISLKCMKFVRKLVKTKVFYYFIVFSIEDVYADLTNLANSLYFRAFSVLSHILPRGAKNGNPTILRT